jgi:hypothetical protein
MTKQYQFNLLSVVFVLLFVPTDTVRAETEPLNLQEIPGGAEVQAIETQVLTITPDEAVNSLIEEIGDEDIPDAEAPAEGPGTGINSAGIGVTSSAHLKVYKIPLSYNITEKLKVGAKIPYVIKNMKGRYGGNELRNEGLGDISAHLKYAFSMKNFRLVSTLVLKFPTGNNKEFDDGQECLALGSGSYDWVLSQAFLVKTDRLKTVRFFGGVSYRLNGPGEYSERGIVFGVPGNYTFKSRAGDAFFGFTGIEWISPIQKLRGYLTVSGIKVWSGEEEYYNDIGIISVKREKDDSLEAVDVIPGIKYQVSKKSAVRVGVSVPVYTRYDPDVSNEEDRGVSVDFGVDYIF